MLGAHERVRPGSERLPATLAFAVPPDASLDGRKSYWQAVVGKPLRVTNVELTTFTTL